MDYVAYYSFKKPNLNDLKVKISVEIIGGNEIINILGKKKRI